MFNLFIPQLVVINHPDMFMTEGELKAVANVFKRCFVYRDSVIFGRLLGFPTTWKGFCDMCCPYYYCWYRFLKFTLVPSGDKRMLTAVIRI